MQALFFLILLLMLAWDLLKLLWRYPVLTLMWGCVAYVLVEGYVMWLRGAPRPPVLLWGTPALAAVYTVSWHLSRRALRGGQAKAATPLPPGSAAPETPAL